jgi:hypothetical protein
MSEKLMMLFKYKKIIFKLLLLFFWFNFIVYMISADFEKI